MSITKKDLLVIEGNLALVSKAEEGLEAKYFISQQKHSGFRKDQLAEFVGIDPKTVDNYRNSKKKFKSDAAEKLLKLHRLFALVALVGFSITAIVMLEKRREKIKKAGVFAEAGD